MSEALGQEKGRVRGIRDRAVLVFGFAAGMRRSELAALDLGDVEISSQGVKVHLRRSKTDQSGEGRWLGIFPGSKAETCPVASLSTWVEARGTQAGWLFTRITMGARATEAPLPEAARRMAEYRAAGGYKLFMDCVAGRHSAEVIIAALDLSHRPRQQVRFRAGQRQSANGLGRSD